jgi:membrane-associated phospholipid phosphatase
MAEKNLVANLIEQDAKLSQDLRLEQGKGSLWRFAAFFAHSGDSWFWMAGLVLVWILTTGEWHTRASLLAVGVVLMAGIVMALKFTIRRRRPDGEWGQVYRNVDPHSFPSGHAARAALLAVLAVGLGPAWFGALLVVWAPLVCLARILTGMHYLSDVLAGILLGMLTGWLVLELQGMWAALLPFLF